eukprot:TRINITY_DN63389_c0_g1_i1.p1 TRINITY_DN63389_c0_g1~~TRINITY_DN63389_c0_g1_i1.p1  ORF type:complete len:120 (-),score=7.84 TRINITY_DN63389_c0_g1_i1:180-539(-)
MRNSIKEFELSRIVYIESLGSEPLKSKLPNSKPQKFTKLLIFCSLVSERPPRTQNFWFRLEGSEIQDPNLKQVSEIQTKISDLKGLNSKIRTKKFIFKNQNQKFWISGIKDFRQQVLDI